MRRLYGRISSINVQKVAWALDEIGLDFDWLDKNGTIGSINSPKYRKLNPAAQIPTLDDDGIIVRQSNTIVRYLANTYPDCNLRPTRSIDYIEADRWMDWQATDFWGALRPVFWELIRIEPKYRDMALINKNIKICHKEVKYLNEFLSNRNFIAGKEFSMGDIPSGCAIYRYYTLPKDIMKRPDLPHLKAWFDRLSNRKAYRNIVMLPLK